MLIDENGREHGIITGDTLFIGDVGRPDLAQHVIADLTEEKLAAHLYDSLHNKILPLSDDLIVYPNHGASSACGKNMSKETTDTLGNQKKTNYALQDMNKKEFIEKLLDGLTLPPGYFPQNVLMNIQGYDSLDTIMERARKPLTAEEFELVANETQALVLDSRDAEDFLKGFIPNSVNIGLEGGFAQWVREMIPDVKQEILLITYEGKEEEALTRLSRVGYDHTIGYLKGGFKTWKEAGKEVDEVQRITPEAFEKNLKTEKMKVIDFRKKSEYDSEHVVDSINIPLNQINQSLAQISKEEPFMIHCAGGYRSTIAASILKQRGWNNIVDVRGGLDAIKNTGVPLTEYVCPTTLL